MANEEYVYWVEPSCSANTAETAFTTTNITLATVFLWRMEVRIPPGHAGLTGIALVDGGSFAIPFSNPGRAWLIGDDDLLSYTYENELGKLNQLATFNTDDTYDHGWQVRLVYTPMSAYSPDEASIEITP